jgi:hypothetical protein
MNIYHNKHTDKFVVLDGKNVEVIGGFVSYDSAKAFVTLFKQGYLFEDEEGVFSILTEPLEEEPEDEVEMSDHPSPPRAEKIV